MNALGMRSSLCRSAPCAITRPLFGACRNARLQVSGAPKCSAAHDDRLASARAEVSGDVSPVKKSAPFELSAWVKSCFTFLGAVALGLVLMLASPTTAEAARSGGRIGGSSFSSRSAASSFRGYSAPSRSAPSPIGAAGSRVGPKVSRSAPSRSSAAGFRYSAPSRSVPSPSRAGGSRLGSRVSTSGADDCFPHCRSAGSSFSGYSAPSRSAPSPGYSSGYSSGYGRSAPVVVAPAPSFGFGFGYPAFGYGVPVASTGGSSLFTLLVLGIFAYVLFQTVTSSFSAQEEEEEYYADEEPMSVVKLQVGLLGSARQIQRDLNRMANNIDTSTPQGLHYLLQETVLALRRNPQYACYGKATLVKTRGLDNAEAKFNQVSMEERGKFESETLSNFGGRRSSSVAKVRGDGLNELIVITIIAAVDGKVEPVDITSVDDLKTDLNLLGSVPASRLLALEVLWTPQDDNDYFTKEQLIEDYPMLNTI